jgi:hypothetical protein
MKASKEVKRRKVAKGIVAGKPVAEIARDAECSERHAYRLQAEPETRSLVVQMLAPHRERLAKATGAAVTTVERALESDQEQRQERIAWLRDRIAKLQTVIAERAVHPEMASVAGGKTGTLTHTLKGIGSGDKAQVVDEYEVDTGLLKELREHERQLRDELNDFTPNLKPVERLGDLLELAQGGTRQAPPAPAPSGNFTLLQIYELLYLTGDENGL